MLVGDLREGGSVAAREDFAGYQARWLEAVRGRYRGRGVAVVPGLNGGPSLLRSLALLEQNWQPGTEPDAMRRSPTPKPFAASTASA